MSEGRWGLVDPLSFTRRGFARHRRAFHPEPVADGRGKVALVTGANSGIGFAASRALSRRGFSVWLLCRDRGRGEEARARLARDADAGSVHLATVDVADLESVRRLARELPVSRVDVLVHNAGALFHDRARTADGVERTFALHVLGPFAMTVLLADRLARSGDARVVFVASGGLYLQRLDLDLVDARGEGFDGVRAYANAKRAQVCLARLLADPADSPGVTFASMHPGWVDTAALSTSLPRFHSLMRSALRTPEEGADTVAWLATRPRVRGEDGLFWFDRRVAPEHAVPWTRESAGDRARLLALCRGLARAGA